MIDQPDLVRRVHHQFVTAGADVLTVNAYQRDALPARSGGSRSRVRGSPAPRVRARHRSSRRASRRHDRGLPVTLRVVLPTRARTAVRGAVAGVRGNRSAPGTVRRPHVVRDDGLDRRGARCSTRRRGDGSPDLDRLVPARRWVEQPAERRTTHRGTGERRGLEHVGRCRPRQLLDTRDGDRVDADAGDRTPTFRRLRERVQRHRGRVPAGRRHDAAARPPRRRAHRGTPTTALGWIDRGATIVGGCCEIGPAHIAEIARRLGRTPVS